MPRLPGFDDPGRDADPFALQGRKGAEVEEIHRLGRAPEIDMVQIEMPVPVGLTLAGVPTENPPSDGFDGFHDRLLLGALTTRAFTSTYLET